MTRSKNTEDPKNNILNRLFRLEQSLLRIDHDLILIIQKMVFDELDPSMVTDARNLLRQVSDDLTTRRMKVKFSRKKLKGVTKVPPDQNNSPAAI